jgi:hypothetical protein
MKQDSKKPNDFNQAQPDLRMAHEERFCKPSGPLAQSMSFTGRLRPSFPGTGVETAISMG